MFILLAIASFLFLRILTAYYSDTHHREITVNTREDATEITIPWFNTNLVFLQCTSPRQRLGLGHVQCAVTLWRDGRR